MGVARGPVDKPTMAALLDHWGLDWSHARESQGWRSILCPVHSEDTPSFRVNVDSGAWKCMSCGIKGGDTLDLIAVHEGLEDFRDILEYAESVPGDRQDDDPQPARRGRVKAPAGRTSLARRGKLTYSRR